MLPAIDRRHWGARRVIRPWAATAIAGIRENGAAVVCVVATVANYEPKVVCALS